MSLAEIFNPAFILTLDFLQNYRTAGPDHDLLEQMAEFRQQVLALLERNEAEAAAQSGTDTAAKGRRMISAWVDEAILTADAPLRQLWIDKPLQKEWRQGRMDGQWFFDELEDLRSSNAEDSALASLALRCLSLDFKGRFYQQEDELRELRQRKARQFGLVPGNHSFPPSLPLIRGFSKIALVVLLLLLALAMTMFWQMGGITDDTSSENISSESNNSYAASVLNVAVIIEALPEPVAVPMAVTANTR